MSDQRTILNNIVKEARPLVEQWLDLAEQFAAFRDTAAEHELDWSQIKAILKARAQDDRDGGHRLEKLLGKADNAASYASMLKWDGGKNNFSSAPVEKVEQPRTAPEKPADAIVPAATVAQGRSSILDPDGGETRRVVVNSTDPRLAIPADGSIPNFLRRFANV